MNKILLIISVYIFTDLSLAAQPVDTPKQVPVVMYEFLGSITRLQPYMVSEKKFNEPKNEKEIEKRLLDLKESSKRLPHSQRLNTASFQISVKAMQDHLAKAHQLFHDGRKSFARRMLNATLDGCSSCHTQVPTGNWPTWRFKTSELEGSTFDKAEFLFATRHYDEALENYNLVIANYTKKTGNQIELENALRKKLYIFVRAKQKSAQAADSFQNDLRNKQWQPALKNQVQGWIDALKKVSLRPNTDTIVSAEDLESFASQAIPPLLTARNQFKPESFVMFLYASGLILHFINNHKASEVTPGLLYWLAICDNHLTHGIFFSLTDEYLKECIVRFPTSPAAKKCYAELESTTLDVYTGSGGIHLPEDVKEELKKYKSLINSL